MTTNIFWCERDKLWVRFTKQKGKTSAEVAMLSPDNPRLTLEWRAVSSGSWPVRYQLGSNKAIAAVCSLKNGVFKKEEGNILTETHLIPYDDLPLTPDMKQEKWKNYQNSGHYDRGMREAAKSDHYFSQNIQEQLLGFLKTVLFNLIVKNFKDCAAYLDELKDIVENDQNTFHQAINSEAARTELDQQISEDSDEFLRESHLKQKKSFMFNTLREEAKILAKDFGEKCTILDEVKIESVEEEKSNLSGAEDVNYEWNSEEDNYPILDDQIAWDSDKDKEISIAPLASQDNNGLSQLELIQVAVLTAQQNYDSWYKGKNNLRGKDGFFTRWEFRHGAYGQVRAANLNQAVADAEELEVAKNQINEFLTGSSTNYHRHSFASFLLDELKDIPNSDWSRISCIKGTNLYDQDEVNSLLNRQAGKECQA